MFVRALIALTALAGLVQAELSLDRLVFSEILFKPSGGDRGEFIELYNPTGAAMDTGAYQVCNAANQCVALAGMIAADSYYVICSDISAYAFCQQATTIQLGSITQLTLKKAGSVADIVTAPGTPPTGSSYVRGTSGSSNSELLVFAYSSTPTVGVGFLGGATVTPAPSPSPPPPIAGIEALLLNEVSTLGDNNRFVEIAFSATTSLSAFEVTFYDASGSVLSTSALQEFTVGSANNGMIFATLSHAITKSVYGVALTGAGFVFDFVSVGGAAIKATAGPASGSTSLSLGSGSVFQQRGSGCSSTAFSWVATNSASKGTINLNQVTTCDVVIFFNEIRTSGASGNYIEFGFTDGLTSSDLAAYTIDLYSRVDNKVFKSFSLDEASMGAESNGIRFGYVSLDADAKRGLRRLASFEPDGVALAKTTSPTQLIVFYSFVGATFTAADGVANGATSNNLAVVSSGGVLFGGYTGTGCGDGQFAFGANGQTIGGLNNGQTISCTQNDPNTDVLSPAPTTPAPTPAPTPFPTPQPTLSTNECANGDARCNINANCIDEPQGYSCECMKGYEGNGFACVDVDECVEESPCAAVGGFCVDNDGTFTCGCLPGFTGDGLTCTDIDECAANPCGPNAGCSNVAGDFTCTCNSGYAGNPKVNIACSDVNECNDNPCSSNGSCINTVGSFVCSCKSGFTGDGFTCNDSNECSSSPCDSSATCSNTAGGFTCTCNSGFIGDGFSCTSISPAPTPVPTPGPTPSAALSSDSPSAMPTVTNQPSFSFGPSLTSNPSAVPSLSDQPSGTNPPSFEPSLSNMPSKTDMPSAVPSLSDAPSS